MSIIVSPTPTRTFDGRKPLVYRRRVALGQGRGVDRALECFIFAEYICWRFEDTGEVYRTEVFLKGHPWFDPIVLEPWEQSIAHLLPKTVTITPQTTIEIR